MMEHAETSLHEVQRADATALPDYNAMGLQELCDSYSAICGLETQIAAVQRRQHLHKLEDNGKNKENRKPDGKNLEALLDTMLTMLEDEKKYCQTLEQRLGYNTHRMGILRDSWRDWEQSASKKYMPSQSIAKNLAKSLNIGTKSKGSRNIICSPNGRTNPAQQTLSARAWIAASTMSHTEASHLARKQEIVQVPCCLPLGETRLGEDATDAEETGEDEGCLQNSAQFFSLDDPMIVTEEKNAMLSESSSMAHSLESLVSASPMMNSVELVHDHRESPVHEPVLVCLNTKDLHASDGKHQALSWQTGKKFEEKITIVALPRVQDQAERSDDLACKSADLASDFASAKAWHSLASVVSWFSSSTHHVAASRKKHWWEQFADPGLAVKYGTHPPDGDSESPAESEGSWKQEMGIALAEESASAHDEYSRQTTFEGDETAYRHVRSTEKRGRDTDILKCFDGDGNVENWTAENLGRTIERDGLEEHAHECKEDQRNHGTTPASKTALSGEKSETIKAEETLAHETDANAAAALLTEWLLAPSTASSRSSAAQVSAAAAALSLPSPPKCSKQLTRGAGAGAGAGAGDSFSLKEPWLSGRRGADHSVQAGEEGVDLSLLLPSEISVSCSTAAHGAAGGQGGTRYSSGDVLMEGRVRRRIRENSSTFSRQLRRAKSIRDLWMPQNVKTRTPHELTSPHANALVAALEKLAMERSARSGSCHFQGGSHHHTHSYSHVYTGPVPSTRAACGESETRPAGKVEARIGGRGVCTASSPLKHANPAEDVKGCDGESTDLSLQESFTSEEPAPIPTTKSQHMVKQERQANGKFSLITIPSTSEETSIMEQRSVQSIMYSKRPRSHEPGNAIEESGHGTIGSFAEHVLSSPTFSPSSDSFDEEEGAMPVMLRIHHDPRMLHDEDICRQVYVRAHARVRASPGTGSSRLSLTMEVEDATGNSVSANNICKLLEMHHWSLSSSSQVPAGRGDLALELSACENDDDDARSSSEQRQDQDHSSDHDEQAEVKAAFELDPMIYRWLVQLKLMHCIGAFLEENITDCAVLASCSHAQLELLGVSRLGDRCKLLARSSKHAHNEQTEEHWNQAQETKLIQGDWQVVLPDETNPAASEEIALPYAKTQGCSAETSLDVEVENTFGDKASQRSSVVRKEFAMKLITAGFQLGEHQERIQMLEFERDVLRTDLDSSLRQWAEMTVKEEVEQLLQEDSQVTENPCRFDENILAAAAGAEAATTELHAAQDEDEKKTEHAASMPHSSTKVVTSDSVELKASQGEDTSDEGNAALRQSDDEAGSEGIISGNEGKSGISFRLENNISSIACVVKEGKEAQSSSQLKVQQDKGVSEQRDVVKASRTGMEHSLQMGQGIPRDSEGCLDHESSPQPLSAPGPVAAHFSPSSGPISTGYLRASEPPTSSPPRRMPPMSPYDFRVRQSTVMATTVDSNGGGDIVRDELGSVQRMERREGEGPRNMKETGIRVNRRRANALHVDEGRVQESAEAFEGAPKCRCVVM